MSEHLEYTQHALRDVKCHKSYPDPSETEAFSGAGALSM